MTTRTVTLGEEVVTIDGEPIREDVAHGVVYRLGAHVLRCEKLLIYGGEMPIDRPEWTLEPADFDANPWAMYPEPATVDQIIGAGERKAAAAHVRRTKTNPEA